MEKNLVPSETNDNESTPLVTEIKKGESESSNAKKASLSNLATELSELSLGAYSQATTASLDEPVPLQEITESQTLGSIGSSDDVEDMSVDQDISVGQVLSDDQVVSDDQVLGDSTPAVESPEEGVTDSPQESESGGRRWLDRTMYMLILEVLMLVFPISMAYYGFAYFKYCEGGDKLPALILILAVLGAITLIGRILINVAIKGEFYDRDIVPPTVVYAGEFLVIVLFIAEFSYSITVDTLSCNEDFYEYVFYMNNIAALFICILIFYNMKKLARCIRILWE